MYENLKKLRLEQGLNQKDFGALFGVKLATYAGYEIGSSDPKTEFWISVAEHFKVSTDFLLDQTSDRHGTKYGARSELDEKYAALDDHGRRLVDAIMEIEADRRTEQEPPVIQIEPPSTKIVPLFPAAAGPGEHQENIAFTEYEVPIRSKAEFAVKVSGDSMEPELHDGDIILCTKRKPMDGELAAVMVNGFLYVKQVEHDDYGNLHLLSINRDRSFLDVHLMLGTQDTVTTYGTLMHRMMPPINWNVGE